MVFRYHISLFPFHRVNGKCHFQSNCFLSLESWWVKKLKVVPFSFNILKFTLKENSQAECRIKLRKSTSSHFQLRKHSILYLCFPPYFSFGIFFFFNLGVSPYRDITGSSSLLGGAELVHQERANRPPRCLLSSHFLIEDFNL